MAEAIPGKFHRTLLKAWHAWIAGSFLVAYVTADDSTAAMHQFAGYAALAAIAARLVVGLVAPVSSPLHLPHPSVQATKAWFSSRQGRHPMFGWMAAALLLSVGLAAVSGALTDIASWLEGPHEVLAEASLWVIFGHIGFVCFIYGGKRLIDRARGWLAEANHPTTTR